ncbi:MAG: hypothetical protein M1308_23265 [Actinobacteria bacterium]|nr:hypothetical protein [Actinomycetota bacterium]
MAQIKSDKSLKRFLSWKLIFIPLFIIVLVVGGNAVKRFQYSREIGNKTIFHYGQLPPCGDKKEFFTVSPIKDGLYRNVVPLGNLGATGGHVIPTKHSYFISPAKNTEEQTDVDVYSPGDLYITWADRWDNLTKGYTDYNIYASPCSDVEVNFYHLNTLNPKIQNAFNKDEHCQSYQAGQTSFKFCGQVIKGVQIKVGELLGTANPARKNSIKQFFDFEMSDHRTPELQFANPSRWTGGFDFKHIVCPFDYFTPDLRQKFLSQMADYYDPSLKRTAEPLCGEYMQDVPGTAQGVWFKPGKTADSEENYDISLVHHNVLAQKGIFSIGTQAMSTIEAGEYPFDTQSSGLVNRDFKDITAEKQIYCFEPSGLTGVYRYPFRIIVQMESKTKLKIEGQKIQNCTDAPWQFSSGASVFER